MERTLELLEISTNDSVRLFFMDTFSSVFALSLFIIFLLYFANLALSFLKNI